MSLRPVPAPSVPEATARVARAAFRKGCLAMRIRDELGPLFEDEQFASAFPCRGGPAWSPGQLAMVSVLQFAEGLTDRQAADAVRGRIDVKYALGLELDDPGFDFSVLSEFRDRLISHGLEELVLNRLLERVGELGLLRAGGRQRTDSTHVLAQVRTLNRMEFVGETLRAALETLAAAAPGWLRQIAVPEWFERYGKRIDSFRFPKGADARQQWALSVGQDGFALLEAAYAPDAPGWLRHMEAVQVLRAAWVQQYHRDDKGVRWREGKDLPPGRLRLSSPYDADTRYSVKRGAGWDGYKVHFTETCESDAPHLITNVATTDATVPDVEITEPVHRALAARGLLPAVHLVDSGYTSAALLVTAAGQDIELMGPVFADTTAQGRAGDGLGQDAFTVDWPARTVICPRGQRSVSWSEQRKPTGTEIIRVHFAKTDCDACPVRAACTSAKSKWGRSLTLLTQPQQEALDQRRCEQQTDEWQAAYGTLAGVEGTISQAVRVTRTRTTPYRGLRKTHLGHVLTAAGLNLHRLNTWWTGTPIGTTHISRFARLGLELAA
ncbi:IS1182 family transposase [Streptomyces sp. F001]|uniref:IS1182 family transposase n=1 Tax=Streptomyces sp. F001 TaxID=1510026 RepID=UPI00101E798B|nr:IS1182 family transposase [Streptomyces sp. F001]RZB19501.1 IS1182 family transposase [Streptomyces sp. F001]